MKILSVILIGIAAVILFGSASAHGGVSNQSGNVIIFLNQQPLSPLAGEEVLLTFSVKNKDMQALSGTGLAFRLIQTGDDPSKDQTIFSQAKNTDVNGNFDFRYKFSDPGYYDAEISMTDPATNKPVSIGFLIQVRDQKLPWINLGAAALLGAALAVAAYSLIKPKKSLQ